MTSKLVALAGGMALALGIFVLPAAAAVAPDAGVSDRAAAPAGNGAVKLAHGWHGHCAWGPRRGWWHRHTRWGPVACGAPGYQIQPYPLPQPVPRCHYNRWGQWVCY